MCRYTDSKWRQKWCTVLGLCLCQCSIGLNWYWGTLSIYVYSYVLRHGTGTADQIQSPWVIFLTLVALTMAWGASAILTKLVGKRMAMTCAVLMVESGLLAAHFTIQHSFMLTAVIIGVVATGGAEIVFCLATQAVMEWPDASILVCVVQTSFPAGAIIMSQVITYYINPDNLNPDVRIGNSKYFSQAEIVDRVPSLFFLLVLISSAAHVAGMCLIKYNEPTSQAAIQTLATSNEASGICQSDVSDGMCESGKAQPTYYNSGSSNDNSSSSNNSSYNSNSSSSNSSSDNNNSYNSIIRSSSNQCTKSDAADDLGPRDILCQATFHYGWVLFAIGEMSFVVSANYYKEFGLTRIQDDHFVSGISIPYLLAAAFCRVAWGLSIQRFGLRTAFAANMACTSLIGLWLYFSPLVSRWCYALTVVAFVATTSPIPSFATIFVAKAFGKTHFLMNQLCAFVPTALLSFALPATLRYIVTKFGWFYLYSFVSACCTIGLVLITSQLPCI